MVVETQAVETTTFNFMLTCYWWFRHLHLMQVQVYSGRRFDYGTENTVPPLSAMPPTQPPG